MTISEIRTKYTSAGDIIFRTAIGWLVEVGTDTAIKEKPDKLLMIEDYVKACAADIAESPEYKSRINDIFQSDKRIVYLVYYEDEEVVKKVVGIYSTYESAMQKYTKVRERITKDYDLDSINVDEDDGYINACSADHDLYVEAYISPEVVE